ncbi:MAG TPA: hypothetical protein PLG15_01725 [Candidatus Gastranaerophilaceae bacterium]|nr:hypothetical protein [Candidatus Gastranaerophilaceae bacterium]HPT41083.1 hypothetical protein [Candidatus Gastranaerophilaceae bacterium]
MVSVKLQTFAKYLDQPALVKHLDKKMPVVLSALGLAYGINDSFQAPKDEQYKTFIQNLSVLSLTIVSALAATRGLKLFGKKIEGLIELPHLHKKDISEVLKKITDDKTKKLIQKVLDDKILKFQEVKNLKENLKKLYDININKIIPDAHNHGAFEELGKLSLLGLIPVLGGITGGVIGDVLTKDNWKKKFPNKIKEGTYQYLNNIFLCNVGAGIALATMNRLKIQSKIARFGAMLAGVVGVGLIAGSAIANFIGKNFINPIFDKKEIPKRDFHSMTANLNSERHPEALDLSLHIDDIASVGFLSGLKWIGPVLPLLYSVSAYRAGIGYRNSK